MEEYGDESTRKISKYNSGVAQIYRLDNLWKDTHRHARLGELLLWNWDLDRVWMELVGDLEKDDKNIEAFKSINEKISQLKIDVANNKIKISDYNSMLYPLLMEKEEFLRRIQNEVGKGSAYEDELEDDWE